MKIRIYILVFLLTFFSSCNREIDFDFPDVEPAIVINSIITPESPISVSISAVMPIAEDSYTVVYDTDEIGTIYSLHVPKPKIVAYHEIGHALVAAMQSNSAPVQKITIVPRTSGALGYTMQVEEGNHYLMSKEEIENKIATFTGGRAAEELVFGSVTTGAANDIEQATKLARAMITRYGMSEDFDMVAMETLTNQYLGGDTSLICSADTQADIDRQVVGLVKKQHEKASRILRENRKKLDELAENLYANETITGEEFMAILNAKDDPEKKLVSV